MSRFLRAYRAARRNTRRGGDGAARNAVMPLTESIEALGSTCWTDDVVDVPVDRIVGTVARQDEFDRELRPLRRHLRDRWESVEAAVRGGATLPPVRLVQAGELYFVVDGHHRVSVARATDRVTVEARVRRVCTVAYACHCLTVLDLPAKAAEREFLERFPLPDDVRPWLWLDDPAGWAEIEAAAKRWVFGDDERPADLEARLERWWHEDVVQTAGRCQGREQVSLDDYLCALRRRDADGCCTG